jgi:1-acyl-sn-glycerol-3-phosphate acyltransferase
MRVLLGTTRIGIIVLFILFCAPIFIFASLIPIRLGIAGIPGWMSVYMARFFNWLFRVRLHCEDAETMRAHQGIFAPNHSSYLDVVVLLAIMPARFLAAMEVKRRPVIGWMAASVDTVFVDRSDTESRRSAVSSVAASYEKNPDPPIVIFPEGRLGFGEHLFPFKLGTFRIARDNGIAYMPIAIHFHEPEVVVWMGGRGESMTEAVWRLACYPGPVHVDVIPLTPVLPELSDDVIELAGRAQYDIEEVLGFPHLDSTYAESK